MKSRKLFIMILAVALVLLTAVSLFAACDPDESDPSAVEPPIVDPPTDVDPPSEDGYTLTFVTGDADVTVEAIKAQAGDEIIPPEDPISSKYYFGGWYETPDLDGNAVDIPTVMPSKNVTYYAKWQVAYALQVYKQPDTLSHNKDDYELDETLSKTGFAPATAASFDLWSIWPKNVVGFRESKVTSDYSLQLTGKDNERKLYLDRVKYTLTVNSGYDGVAAVTADMYYGVQEKAVNLFNNVSRRFLGYATSSGGPVVYPQGELFSISSNTTLWAVWQEGGFEDALGGNDYLYLDENDPTVIYLNRVGVPEIKGTLAEDGVSFTFDSGDLHLEGKLNKVFRKFSYKKEYIEGEYILFSDIYNGVMDEEVKLTLGEYGSASLNVRGTVIGGDYMADYDTGFFRFVSAEKHADELEQWNEFIFDVSQSHSITFDPSTGEVIEEKYNYAFALQGKEAGYYYSLKYDTEYDDYVTSFPVVSLDGFGNAYYFVDRYTPATQLAYMPTDKFAEQYPAVYQVVNDGEITLLYIDEEQNTIELVYTFRWQEMSFSDGAENITLRIQEERVGVQGVYDFEEDGVRERLILDGYGGAQYGTLDEEGAFTFVSKGNYTLTEDASFTEYYDDEASDVFRIIDRVYVTLTYTAESGESSHWRLQGTPEYHAPVRGEDGSVITAGYWQNGSTYHLREELGVLGLYEVQNGPATLGETVTGPFGGVELDVHYLFLTGMNYLGMENYAEYWATTEYSQYSELVAYGSVTKNADGNYTFTFTDQRGHLNDYFPIDSFNFSVIGTGTNKVVRLDSNPIVFTTHDDVTITVDEHGVASANGQVVEYSRFSIDPVGAQVSGTELLGYIYEFHVGDNAYYFYGSVLKNYTAIYEKVELYAPISQSDQGGYYTRLYRAITPSETGINAVEVTFESGTYGDSGKHRVYTVSEGIIEDMGDGVYTYTCKVGFKMNWSSYYNGEELEAGKFAFKYLDESTFIIGKKDFPSGKVYDLEGKEIGNFVADTYGDSNLTLNGEEHVGFMERTFRAHHLNLHDYIPSSFFGNSDYRMVLTFTDGSSGKEYVFITANIDTDPEYKFYFVDLDAMPVFGAYSDSSGLNSYYFFFNGEVYNAAIGSQGLSAPSGGMTGGGGGTYTLYDEENNIYELKLTAERDGELVRTVYLRLEEKELEDGTLQKQYSIYRTLLDLDMRIFTGRSLESAVQDGRVTGDGYENYVYTDASGKEYIIYQIEINTNTGILSFAYIDDEGDLETLLFDIAERNGERVAWRRTSIKQDITMSVRELLRDTFLRTDGHDNAWLYVTGQETEEEAIFGRVEFEEGNPEARFVPEEEGYEDLAFVFMLYYMANADGSVDYYLYIEYFEEYDGTFASSDDHTALVLNGYEDAMYIDKYGMAYSGIYEVLGDKKSVVSFYNPSIGYVYYHAFYRADGRLEYLTAYKDDFIVEDNLLLGYQGEDMDVRNIPSEVDTVYSLAFAEMNIISIDLAHIKHIQSYAFYHCEQLIYALNTDELLTVGDFAFSRCGNFGYYELIGLDDEELAVLRLENVQSIGISAFYNCLYLSDVYVGGSVSYIGDGAFGWIGGSVSKGLNFHFLAEEVTDINSVFGDLVFYNTDVRIYLQNIEVAKALLGSPLAMRVATIDLDSNNLEYCYYQVIRLVNELDGAEFGYYMRLDLPDMQKTAAANIEHWNEVGNLFIRLDGRINGDNYYYIDQYTQQEQEENGGIVYKYQTPYQGLLYGIDKDNKVGVLSFDEETLEVSAENIGEYDPETKELTLRGVRYAYIGTNERREDIIPVVYTASDGSGSTLTVAPWLSNYASNAGFYAIEETAENLVSTMVYYDASSECTYSGRWDFFNQASLSQPDNSRKGVYLTSLYNYTHTFYFRFNSDKTFTVLESQIYYHYPSAKLPNASDKRIYLVTSLNEEGGYDVKLSGTVNVYDDTNDGFIYQVTTQESHRFNFSLEGTTLSFDAVVNNMYFNGINYDGSYHFVFELGNTFDDNQFRYTIKEVKMDYGVKQYLFSDESLNYAIPYHYDRDGNATLLTFGYMSKTSTMGFSYLRTTDNTVAVKNVSDTEDIVSGYLNGQAFAYKFTLADGAFSYETSDDSMFSVHRFTYNSYDVQAIFKKNAEGKDVLIKYALRTAGSSSSFSVYDVAASEQQELEDGTLNVALHIPASYRNYTYFIFDNRGEAFKAYVRRDVYDSRRNYYLRAYIDVEDPNVLYKVEDFYLYYQNSSADNGYKSIGEDVQMDVKGNVITYTTEDTKYTVTYSGSSSSQSITVEVEDLKAEG